VQGTQLAPAAIILDAELTLPTPERLWYVDYTAEFLLYLPSHDRLSTGIRALDHAVGRSLYAFVFSYEHKQFPENLYRTPFPEPLRALCYSAIRDLFILLPQSRDNPQDLEVRQKLQIAAWKSFWPVRQEKFGPLGLSHSLGHQLGATYGIGHGITSVRLFDLFHLQDD
jgi:alcohol dehydrogenase class IV